MHLIHPQRWKTTFVSLWCRGAIRGQAGIHQTFSLLFLLAPSGYVNERLWVWQNQSFSYRCRHRIIWSSCILSKQHILKSWTVHVLGVSFLCESRLLEISKCCAQRRFKVVCGAKELIFHRLWTHSVSSKPITSFGKSPLRQINLENVCAWIRSKLFSPGL